jgi:hypothetical protein
MKSAILFINQFVKYEYENTVCVCTEKNNYIILYLRMDVVKGDLRRFQTTVLNARIK